ncbi:MAG: processing protein [Candidatus Binatota bacterium]|nr:processing protein [Candidatus Binatota bacterium]
MRVARALGGPERVLRDSPARLDQAGAPRSLLEALRQRPDAGAIDGEIEAAKRAGAEIVDFDDPRYPRVLRFIPDPPPVLYVRGTLISDDSLAVAVVGSRDASPYGLAAADVIARGLAARGVTVVSGLAIGIDGAAHRAALAGGGRTIAVLGCGIDRIYPPRHARLAGEIAERGAVISEFPIGAPPLAHHFPRRNRIVSGSSLCVVVVEGSERSGSMITARLGNDQGRVVCAVPGEIGLARTRGTHRLLRAGAVLVESGDDVIAEVVPWLLEPSGEIGEGSRSLAGLGQDATRLLECFDATVLPIDRLVEKSGLSPERALEVLFELEIAGRVRRHPGMTFSRSREGGGMASAAKLR